LEEVGRCGGVSIGGLRTDFFAPTSLSAKRGLRISCKDKPSEHLKTTLGKLFPDRPQPMEQKPPNNDESVPSHLLQMNKKSLLLD